MKKLAVLAMTVASLGLLALGGPLLATPEVSAQEVTVTDLGTLGGGWSQAHGINKLGQVVGYSSTASGSYHAFLWTAEGGLVDLDTLGIYGDALGPYYSRAWGINDLGQVVGGSTTASGSYHAFLWTAGEMLDLSTLGGNYSRAYGINDLGQVVGGSTTASGYTHAFLWTAQGGMVDLGTLGGNYSEAYGINDLGQVVGYSTTASGYGHAFLWTAQGGMVDLGTLGGNYSYALGINNLGQVVGQSTTASEPYHAFLWTAQGGMVDLGHLGGEYSIAWSINDLGHVVGQSLSPTVLGSWHAFLWTAQGGMVDLGHLGGGDSVAYGINNLGQVVGWSTTASGYRHAALWTLPMVAPFAAFDAKVEIELGPLASDDEFEVKATFTLGAGSDGIDPVAEDMSLELTGGSGAFSITIPAGSFKFHPAKPGNKGKPEKPAKWTFEGIIGGVALEAKITDLGGGSFEFKAEGEGAELTGMVNPVTVGLTIGNDGGSTPVTAEFE